MHKANIWQEMHPHINRLFGKVECIGVCFLFFTILYCSLFKMCVYVYMCTTFAAGKLIYIIINEEIYNQENGLKNKNCVSVDKIYNINRNTKKYIRNLKITCVSTRVKTLRMLLSQSLFHRFGACQLCSFVPGSWPQLTWVSLCHLHVNELTNHVRPGALWPASWNSVTWAPQLNLWLIQSDMQHIYSMNCISESCSSKHFKIEMFKPNVIPLLPNSSKLFPMTSAGDACMLSRFSHVRLFVTVAHQAPLSLGFSRQQYWSGLPFPPAGDLPNPGIKPRSLTSPVLAGGLFTTSATWKAPYWE